MINKRIIITVFAFVILISSAFALSDALGLFNDKEYTAVSHGSHVHYVPTNRDADVSISRFPTTEPGPDEIISPTGQIINKSNTK